MTTRCFTLCMLVLTGGLASAGEVGFREKPIATAEAGGVKIRFAVSAPTDVEVAVLDGGGRTIRHLAAGKLGGSTPLRRRRSSRG